MLLVWNTWLVVLFSCWHRCCQINIDSSTVSNFSVYEKRKQISQRPSRFIDTRKRTQTVRKMMENGVKNLAPQPARAPKQTATFLSNTYKLQCEQLWFIITIFSEERFSLAQPSADRRLRTARTRNQGLKCNVASSLNTHSSTKLSSYVTFYFRVKIKRRWRKRTIPHPLVQFCFEAIGDMTVFQGNCILL